MKKFVSVFLSLCLLAGSVHAASSEESTAKILFDKKTEYTNIDWTYFCPEGETVVEIGGKNALKMDCSSDRTRFYNVGISDKWLYAPEGCTVEIAVDYYDTGSGCFGISYDGTNNTDYGGYACSDTEIVHMTDDNAWKTHVFYIEDMRATNAYEGRDFRIGLWTPTMGISEDDIYIKSIEIKKVYPRVPVKISGTSKFYGNIFGANDDKKVNVTFNNVVDDKMNTTVSYNVTDEDEKIIARGEFTRDPELKSETTEIDLNSVSEFGVYKINLTAVSEVEVEGEKRTFTSEKSIDFSVINKAENGEVNSRQYVCTHGGWYGAEMTAEIASYAGFGGVRDEISWDSVETEKGKYNVPKIGDDYINAITGFGMDYLYVADYGNPHYDNTVPYKYSIAPSSDTGIKAYADYCAYMAKKYKGTIKCIEIWNEYNIKNFNFMEYDGAMYAKMLKAAYTAIKAVNPEVTVVGMATAGTDTNFMSEVLEAGGYDYMDAVSIHPYNWSAAIFNPISFKERIESVKQLFREYGGEKPVWFSEFGCTTSQNGSSYEFTPAGQAQLVVKVYATGTAEKLFERNYWYDLQNDGTNSRESEHHFGLVKSVNDDSTPLAAKPAFVAMAGMNKLMGGAEFLSSVYSEKGYYAYNFRAKDGGNIAVLWADKDREQSVGIKLGTDEAELLDIYTNPMGRISGKDGVFNIALGEEPIYIRGNFSEFAEASPEIVQNVLKTKIMPNDMMKIEFKDAGGRNLRLEAESVGGAEIVSHDIKDGVGEIEIKSGAEFSGNRRPGIKVFDSDKLVYASFAELEAADAVVAEIKTSQVGKQDPNHWQAEVTIKNESHTNAVSGNCRIVKKNGAIVDSKPVFFDNLKAGGTVTLYMNLDTMVKRRNVDLTFEIELDSGYKTDITKSVDFTSAKYAKKKPIIDGKLDLGEWSGDWMAVDEKSRVKQIKDWGGINDLSFDCNLMWDEEYFYVATVVSDNVFCQNEKADKSWAGDSFQFALEDKINTGNFVVDPNGVGVSFTELCAALISGKPMLYRHSSQDNKNETGIVANAKTAISRVGEKTIYEIAVPWEEVFGKGYVLDENKILGYSMLVNDNDGSGRRGWIEYNQGIGLVKNALYFGRMTLMR